MKETFAVLNRMVEDGAIDDYALVGAIGAMFYVEPFSTQDIDVLVLMPAAESGLISELPGWDYLRKHGYTETRRESIVVEGWPVQFLPVSDPLEHEAYLNAEKLAFEGTPVRVALAEHLVAIMLKVGRPKDFARIQMFWSENAVRRDAFRDIISRHGLTEKWRQTTTRYNLEE